MNRTARIAKRLLFAGILLVILWSIADSVIFGPAVLRAGPFRKCGGHVDVTAETVMNGDQLFHHRCRQCGFEETIYPGHRPHKGLGE